MWRKSATRNFNCIYWHNTYMYTVLRIIESDSVPKLKCVKRGRNSTWVVDVSKNSNEAEHNKEIWNYLENNTPLLSTLKGSYMVLDIAIEPDDKDVISCYRIDNRIMKLLVELEIQLEISYYAVYFQGEDTNKLN